MDTTLACFKGKYDSVKERSFNIYLREMNIIKKRSDLSEIKRVELIANYENKIRTLYTFFDLNKCDDDQLTYIIKIYSKILNILKELKPQDDDELTEYKNYYKDVEITQNKIREARKDIIVKLITRAVNKSRSQSVFHIPNDMRHEESVSALDFAKPRKTNSKNPFGRGNDNLHKKFVEEQKAKKQLSSSSLDVPPPPPPRQSLNIVTPPESPSESPRERYTPFRIAQLVNADNAVSAHSSLITAPYSANQIRNSYLCDSLMGVSNDKMCTKLSEKQPAIVTPTKGQRTVSREYSPNNLLDSRSLGSSIGMTARRVPNLSIRKKGGKTRKMKKHRKN